MGKTAPGGIGRSEEGSGRGSGAGGGSASGRNCPQGKGVGGVGYIAPCSELLIHVTQ